MSPERRSLVWVLLATLAIGSGMFVEPFGIASGDAFRDNDWLNTRSFDVHSRIALLEHGEFPLRSHLLGGGFPTIAHPSDGSWSPTLLAVLLFGDVIGVKLNLLFLLLLGGWGMLGLARHGGASEGGARVSAALFVLSGWLPSMLLVGFYNQAFFLLAPAVARLMLARDLRSALLGGGLLAVILQQGGHAFPATCFFLGLLAWMDAWRDRVAIGVASILLFLGPLGFVQETGALWPLLAWLPAVALVLSPAGRPGIAHWAPSAKALALVLVVACSLGAARIVGIGWMGQQGSSYEHTLVRTGATWFPDTDGPTLREERFYEDVPAFLASLWSRVPSEGTYGTTWGRIGDPLDYEYSYLGMTPVGMGLLLIGLLLAIRRPEARPWAVLWALMVGVCFGWEAPLDLHFLLTWGVPFLDSFSQPIKYWNVFVLITGCVLAGVAADALLKRADGDQRRVVGIALALLLLWPLLQNRSAFEDTFAEPVPTLPAGEFAPIASVAEPGWVAFDDVDIRAMSDELFLRDYGRPAGASEYVNLQRNVGTVDHYGSLVMPEVTLPARYVTLAGEEIDNPRYAGEAWLEGAGTVHAVRLTPNSMTVDVESSGPVRLVINQVFLDGFESSESTAVKHPDGFLSVDLTASGRRSVELGWRPAPILAGLGWSAVSFVLWCGLLWRRRG